MGFDFETLLVALTLLTGAIWAWDKARGKRRTLAEGAEATVPWWLDLSRSLFPVILAVLVIRSFIVEPFRIPSGSMIPTLFSGDFILVNKFAYGLRLPALRTKVAELGEPARGDVAVFRYPVQPTQDYIKRIIGVPGDHVVYRDKQLYINGERVPQVPVGVYTGPEHEPGAQIKREQLSAAEYQVVLHAQSLDLNFEYRVPARNYFVLGDNRDRSSDSRFWGPVPEENLVGKAFLIWMSWDPERNRINWARIGDRIR
jgi:signal peptidase I